MTRPPEPPDPAKVLGAALDVFVYAPIGFLLDARELVPKLAERGRNQVALARLFGRYAVQRGQAEADRIMNRDRQPPAAPAQPPGDAATAPGDAATAPAAAGESTTSVAAGGRRGASRRATAASALPIPGYNSLSASQVVPRLDALRSDELEAVRQYEVAHRGRRTILNRIAQLQG